MESKIDDQKYLRVYISFQLSEHANKLLTESCARSGRKKIPEAALRLEDHLRRYRSISELDQASLNPFDQLEDLHVCTPHS